MTEQAKFSYLPLGKALEEKKSNWRPMKLRNESNWKVQKVAD